jgi:hypothetical protein
MRSKQNKIIYEMLKMSSLFLVDKNSQTAYENEISLKLSFLSPVDL